LGFTHHDPGGNLKTDRYVIGIDVGTSSLKAALFDAGMKQVSFHQIEYPLIHKENGDIEQDPARWYEALCNAVKCVTADINIGRVAAMALSTQGGTLVGLDNRYEPTMNAISWMDNRFVCRDELLPDGMGEADLRLATGWDLSNLSIYSKLRWYILKNPAALEGIRFYADCFSFLSYKLCGQLAIDLTNAAISQLFDIEKKCWHDSFLSHVALETGRLPDPVQSGTTLGTLTRQAGKDLGLSENTAVVAGGHDQYCAALGAGVMRGGECLLSGGTAWVMLAVLDRLDRSVRSCGGDFACGLHVVDGLYGVLSSIPRAGAAVTWFHDSFFSSSENPIDDGSIASDSGGLKFTFDPSGRMSFQNIDFHHKPPHFLRAIMEGIAGDLNGSISGWAKCGVLVDKFIMTGGAARSTVWPQIVANVTQRVVKLPEYSEFACRGAALLAGMGSGLFESRSLSEAVSLNYPGGADIEPGAMDM
jgi:xylulokinase